MLLILTNSVDGTSDEIIRRVGSSRAFRFNIDLWRDYEIRVDANGFRFADPTGRECHSIDVEAAYLRKPSFDDPLTIPDGGCAENWLRAQISYLLQEIYNWCRDAGLVRLVEKGAQQRFGKFSQLRLAQKYFAVPSWEFIKTSSQIAFPQPCISKPLTADFIEDYKVVFTRSVTPEDLNPKFPWLLQEQIEADADVTVVFVAGRCFAFALDRTTFEGVDWRKHINKIKLDWRRIHLAPFMEGAIRRYMNDADLQFGRLDFLQDDGKALYFLEVNPNGQWAWLDVEGTEGIFDAVVEELTKDWIEHSDEVNTPLSSP
jgi:hypothetical protein